MTDVHQVLAAELPGYRVTSVQPLGAGLDNEAYQVNDDLVVRFRRGDPAGVEREARLLRLVGAVSPLPVPEPLFVDGVRGCLGYRLLPGVPLLGRPPGAAVPAALGRFLAVLHAIPLSRVAGLVETDAAPPVEWLDETVTSWPELSPLVPAADRPAVERFLTAVPPPPASRLVFSHQDLGAEHVLVDPTTEAPTAIIDWTDAAVGDPAYDFGLILRDLGPAALATALRIYDGAIPAAPAERAALRERARFYARCAFLEDLPLHGGENLTMLPRLF